MFRYVIVLMIGLCFSSRAHADVLILQSGQRIVGQVIEKTELRVTVNVKGVPETFFLGEIASIVNTAKGPIKANKPKLANAAMAIQPHVPASQEQVKAANVVSTPDGGIIVVTPEKITKYDKDLNVVKVVDLKG